MSTVLARNNLCIDDLPLEILLDIFHRFAQISNSDFKELLSTQHPRGPQAPEILSQVCYLWRQLAHTCPTLWTQLVLKANAGKACLGQRQFLTQWFSRSRAVDLVLTLDPLRVGFQLQDMLSLVCAHSSIWRRLRISLPWVGIMSFFLVGTLHSPQLEELVIECAHSNSPAAAWLYPGHLIVKQGSRKTTIADCARLRKVSVALLPSFPLDSLRELLPWSKLTEVIIQKPGAHPDLIQHVFTQCKSLVRLKIWTAYWRHFNFSMEPSDELRLEHIESFEVTADLRALVHLLRSVQLPALKSLTLSGIADYNDEQYPVQPTLATAFAEFQEHSQFNLLELGVYGLLDFYSTSGLQLKELLQILAGNSGLTSLALECQRREVGESLLDCVSTGYLVDEGDGQLQVKLPKLMTISVSDGERKTTSSERRSSTS
ncbi:hypothetical protein EV361DRAFT_289612 [Lentinula raphanica]|nr:hypothetical protein EV361DRAFT_289612 [Lentinula raphanica]